jgi:hypothetical protein
MDFSSYGQEETTFYYSPTDDKKEFQEDGSRAGLGQQSNELQFLDCM